MKLLEHFRTFLIDTVNLKPSKLDDLNERVPRITNAIESDTTVGHLVLDTVPQGSWAHRTIIGPKPGEEFDADFLVQIEENAHWNANPSAYADAVWNALSASSTYKEMSKRKNRCIRVTYANDCHVDVVPYVVLANGREVIINRTTNEFEDTNPVAFTDWLQERDDVTGGDLRKVIRLLKYLRDHCNAFDIKSVLLTTVVGGVVEPWRTTLDADYYKDAPTTLVNVVEDLAEWLRCRPIKPSIADPGCPSTTFDHRWTDLQYEAFRTKILALAPRVRAAYDAETVSESLAGWQGVFGDAFKAPATSARSASLTKSHALPASIVRGARAPGEEFIDDKFPVHITSSLRIECEVGEPASMNRAQKRKARRLRARGHHVRPGRSLMFRVVHTDVDEPDVIYWKVRNRGPEAKRRGERGQLIADNGQRCRSETSCFAGNHYVECYVVKNGVCVAAAHEPVNIDN